MNPMPTTRTSRMLALALLASLLTMGARSPAAEAHEDGNEPAQLVGTWKVTVTLVNCATRQQVGNPFPALLTFGRGGTFTETTANSFFPAVRSPGHGAWIALDDQGYHAASTAFIARDGVLIRTQTITQEIEVSDDTLTSNATTEFFDPSGALLFKGCATAAGQRYRP